jgi:acyl transferase domain-containing protein
MLPPGAKRGLSHDDGDDGPPRPGVAILERAFDAERCGRTALALIRGWAINQDGRTNGLAAPSRTAQAKVVRAALARAGIEPGAVAYVETHGTGTVLGDTIEVGALAGADARRPRSGSDRSGRTSGISKQRPAWPGW